MSGAIKLVPAKLAQQAVEGEAFEQKCKNAAKLLRDDFEAIKVSSPKAREYKEMLGKNLEDLEAVISSRVGNISRLNAEVLADVNALENSADLIAQARSLANAESSKSQKARAPR